MLFLNLSLSASVLLVIIGFNQVRSQAFIRDCNDPGILVHVQAEGHTYCNHACSVETTAPAAGAGAAVCDPSGHCLCPCDPALPQGTFDPDICPPGLADIPDTDATWVTTCATTCAGLCTGAQSQVCGTIENDVSKICVCICPTTACPTTANTTTTTVAPATANTQLLLPFLLPYLLKVAALIKIRFAQLYLNGVFGLGLAIIFISLNFVLFILCEIFLYTINRPFWRTVIGVLRMIVIQLRI